MSPALRARVTLVLLALAILGGILQGLPEAVSATADLWR